MTYNVTVIATDGDHRTEGEFETVEDAWDYINDMGSRWYFYPVNVVSDHDIIIESPDGFDYLNGMNVRDLANVATELSDTCEMFS